MAKSVLLLRLEGPLQAWGSRARWDVRDTQPEPTKSGIIGLLGCAMGLPKGDPRLETELDTGLRFGVRVENPGRVLVDYHTITDYLPTAGREWKAAANQRSKSLERLQSDPDSRPATVVSPRAYLQDAAFLVTLEETGNHGTLLERCATAIQHPQWPLYLGRKACIPTRPIFERLADEYESIEDALRRHPWSWLGARAAVRTPAVMPRSLTAWVEVVAAGQPGLVVRQDAIRTNLARQYGFRNAQCLDVPLASVYTAKETGP